MSKACIDRSDSLIFQHERRPRVIGFTYASSEVHFRSTESQTFHRSIMTADDSIKCRCANSGMTGQVGGFQNPGVCLQAFPSFLPHPLSALLFAPFFARPLTLVLRSLLLNRAETLATQANMSAAPSLKTSSTTSFLEVSLSMKILSKGRREGTSRAHFRRKKKAKRLRRRQHPVSSRNIVGNKRHLRFYCLSVFLNHHPQLLSVVCVCVFRGKGGGGVAVSPLTLIRL